MADEVTTEEVAEEVVEEVEEEVQVEEPAEEVVEEVAEVKPKQTAQERINEVTRKRREAERDAEYWKNKALSQPPPAPAKVETPVEPSGRPSLENYDTTEQYEDAVYDWRRSKEIAREQTANVEKEYEKQLGDFNSRATELRKEHADFDAVIESEVFTPNMRRAILVSEKGPALAYCLGLPENREIADRIRNLSDTAQVYELGKLETKLEVMSKTKKVPKAPDPVVPLGAGGGGAEKDPSKMSVDEWMEWDRKRAYEKRIEGRG